MYNDSVGEAGMLNVQKEEGAEEGAEGTEGISEGISEGIDFDAIFGKFVNLSDAAREKLVVEDPSFKTSN